MIPWKSLHSPQRSCIKRCEPQAAFLLVFLLHIDMVAVRLIVKASAILILPGISRRPFSHKHLLVYPSVPRLDLTDCVVPGCDIPGLPEKQDDLNISRSSISTEPMYLSVVGHRLQQQKPKA